MPHGSKILVVDDDTRMCDSLEVLLGKEGYEIQTRHSGQEALEVLNKEAFDVVLLDLVLPDINGVETMHYVSSQTPEASIIVMTGYASWDSAVDSLKMGAFDYIRKPFEYEELSRVVKSALDHKALTTEQRRIEKALRESEEKYKTLVESSLTGVFIHQDGKYVFVNDRFAQIHGYRPEELLGKAYLTLIHPDERDASAQIASGRLKGETFPQRYEVRRLRKDGETIWCEMMATLIEYAGRPAVMGNIIDITERKSSQEALRQSERRFRDTANLLPSIICEIDPDMQLTYVNKAGFEIFGYSRADFDAGIRVTNLFHPDDREKLAKRVGQLLQGSRLAATEYRMLTKNGEELTVLINSVPMYENGKIVGIRSSLVDVTKMKQLQAQLDQAQRMESIGTLAGGIAHDFNNLLMGIQGRTSLMLMDMDAEHPHHGHVSGIGDAVQRGAYLCKQLLGFARGGKYEVGPTDLNRLVRKSSKMFGRTKKEIRIHGDYEKALWTVETDRGQIQQVLLDLFVNAWQAMPEGGDLYLSTNNVALDEEHTRPFNLEPGNYVKISIRDTGVGMDETTRQRAFEPFFTTKKMGGGSGLGLASAYGIVKNHGGMINVYSEPGCGSKFDVYLPASDKEVPKDEELSAEMFKGTETVLLVDDEDMILEVGEEMLETLGYEVMLARGGREAIELYKENQEKIDMVILDMIMPDMGGGEVYDRLKKISREAKVLLASGYSVEGLANEILQRGCDGFIQKPFDLRHLSAKLREILDEE